jgi:hypothetical protein
MRRLSYFELEACERAGEESNLCSPSVPAVRLAPQHTMEELIALEDAYGAHNYHPLDVWCAAASAKRGEGGAVTLDTAPRERR